MVSNDEGSQQSVQHTQVDVTERAAANLAANSVLVTDTEILFWSALSRA